VTRSDRLRRIGWAVLAIGLMCAAIVYWVEAHGADAALNDATALGYRRSLDHQMGVMMGHFGLMLTQWQEWLTSPIGEASMIAVTAGLLAAYFFRVAWVLDQED